MSERKNIDTFFQDRLEHFEVTPPEMAWENIEAKLKEKKEKRKVIPFWWKFSGIAASLVIGFVLYDAYFNNVPKTSNSVVHQNNEQLIEKEKNSNSKELNTTVNQEGIVSGNNTNSNELKTTVNQERIVSGNKNSTNVIPNNLNKNNLSDKKNSVTETSNLKDEAVSNKIINATNKAQQNSSIVTNSINQKSINKKKKEKTAIGIKNISNQGDENGSLVLNSNSKNKNNNTKLNGSETPSTNLVLDSSVEKWNENTKKIDLNNTIIEKNKNGITTISDSEIIDKKLNEIKKIDSTKTADVEPNALEELLKEKEKKIAKEQKLNRWQVTPNIAPIYFSSISNGSPLDEKLVSNDKVYGTNYSYGLAVNYKLNKKLNLRSGINTFSVDYDTKNIVFYQNTNASKMQNLSPNLQGSLIQIDPLNNVNPAFNRILGEKFEGTLNQRMAYIEMPLEVSYKLLSKKFGVDVIGGISTLFLSQNDVYLKTTGFDMKIGQASNLNNIHFSTNIGLGLKYSFLKRFDARIEPLFKYQLNTYSSGAGNFKPYVFGVYSGISYHF